MDLKIAKDVFHANEINEASEKMLRVLYMGKREDILVIQNLAERIGRLIKKRDTFMTGSYRMLNVSVMSESSMEIQHQVMHHAEIYFQGVYSVISHMANLLGRLHPKHKNHVPSSMERFINDFVGRNFPKMKPQDIETLEKARYFRTILDHPTSVQTTDWMTTSADYPDVINVIIFGKGNAGGSAPRYSVDARNGGFITDADWYLTMPSILETEASLKKLYLQIYKSIVRKRKAGAKSN